MKLKDYIIRQAVYKEIDEIMIFIDCYWSKGHILSRDRKLFEWQYLDGEKLNFIIAKKNDEIIALLGFVLVNETIGEGVILALWKAKDSIYPFIGGELLQYLEEIGGRDILCNGINIKTTKNIYEFMGYKISHLSHYYRLAERSKYTISLIKSKHILPCSKDKGYKLRRLRDFKEFVEIFNYSSYSQNINIFPHKSMKYLKHRFFEHPYYTYMAIGIESDEKKVNSVLFMREIKCKKKKVLRVVDFLGDVNDLKYISSEIQRLLEEGEYEYIDFMEYGIDDEIMHAAGFILNEENSENIIPNYFEPYLCSNITVWISSKCDKKFMLFKADGDQDRPNRVEVYNGL